ncbi:hypothetical protein FGB62_273g00 [Gracilaria domingensis]|nr:hypothetical protein FGB62_273g00 [Gracilaria domingensis]
MFNDVHGTGRGTALCGSAAERGRSRAGDERERSAKVGSCRTNDDRERSTLQLIGFGGDENEELSLDVRGDDNFCEFTESQDAVQSFTVTSASPVHDVQHESRLHAVQFQQFTFLVRLAHRLKLMDKLQHPRCARRRYVIRDHGETDEDARAFAPNVREWGRHRRVSCSA